MNFSIFVKFNQVKEMKNCINVTPNIRNISAFHMPDHVSKHGCSELEREIIQFITL